ncbi:MAG: septum formation family protein [bacterium]|nr:septum formation family protein [bacterium]
MTRTSFRAGAMAGIAALALAVSACGGEEQVVVPTAPAATTTAPTTPEPTTPAAPPDAPPPDVDGMATTTAVRGVPARAVLDPAGDPAAFLAEMKSSGGPIAAGMEDDVLTGAAASVCELHPQTVGPQDFEWQQFYIGAFGTAIGDGTILEQFPASDIVQYVQQLVRLSGAFVCPEFQDDATAVADRYQPVYEGWDGTGEIPTIATWSAGPDGLPVSPPDAAQKTVFELTPGECLIASEVNASTDGYAGVFDCAHPHDLELFAATEMQDATFPGDAAAETFAGEYCHAEFETFVGTPALESRLGMYYLYPVQQTWDELDDREVLCFIETPTMVFGSLQGAAL